MPPQRSAQTQRRRQHRRAQSPLPETRLVLHAGSENVQPSKRRGGGRAQCRGRDRSEPLAQPPHLPAGVAVARLLGRRAAALGDLQLPLHPARARLPPQHAGRVGGVADRQPVLRLPLPRRCLAQLPHVVLRGRGDRHRPEEDRAPLPQVLVRRPRRGRRRPAARPPPPRRPRRAPPATTSLTPSQVCDRLPRDDPVGRVLAGDPGLEADAAAPARAAAQEARPAEGRERLPHRQAAGRVLHARALGGVHVVGDRDRQRQPRPRRQPEPHVVDRADLAGGHRPRLRRRRLLELRRRVHRKGDRAPRRVVPHQHGAHPLHGRRVRLERADARAVLHRRRLRRALRPRPAVPLVALLGAHHVDEDAVRRTRHHL